MFMISLVRTVCALLLVAVPFAVSTAEEIKVISQANIVGPVEKLLPVFEKQSGVKVSFAWGNPGVTLARLRASEPSDVVIVTTTIFDEVVKDGYLNRETAYPLVRGRIGVGVASTEPEPNIPDKEAFKEFMLKAKSVGFVDPKGGSGTSPPVLAALNAMGIGPEISAKTKFYAGAGDAVARGLAGGEVQVGITAVSELMPQAGLRVAPIPFDVLPTPGTTYIGLRHPSEATAAVKAFVEFMRSDTASKVFAVSGLEPIR
jgi:molybdate transport system substrate-binding protein